MKFEIEINNFGKAKHAKLKLAPFSVIAGANSSGKSFVSRALYSFFSTINKDHVTATTIDSVQQIKSLLIMATRSYNQPSIAINFLSDELNVLIENLIVSINKIFGECTFIEQHSRSIFVHEQIISAEKVCLKLLLELEGKKKYENSENTIRHASHLLKRLSLSVKEPAKILSEKIEKGFTEALKENFQVPNLSDLKSFSADVDEKISFNFKTLGEIKIDKERIDFKLTAESVHEFQSLYNVVFIESPIYWKLRKPLLRAKERGLHSLRRFHRETELLTGVPKYFYDLIELVDENIKSNSRSDDMFWLQENISKNIGGELDISESGDIFFKDTTSSNNININLTATGVTNLGLIGLLLKRNVIAKGSFIFIDEPEVNLHPAWQKVMIETLYKLSRNGINIVIASHSIDMMKYIENIMETLGDDEIKDHFAINRLSKDGISSDLDTHPMQAMSKIKEDLGSSFYDMVLESSW